jgi:hypothetical protein
MALRAQPARHGLAQIGLIFQDEQAHAGRILPPIRESQRGFGVGDTGISTGHAAPLKHPE